MTFSFASSIKTNVIKSVNTKENLKDKGFCIYFCRKKPHHARISAEWRKTKSERKLLGETDGKRKLAM